MPDVDNNENDREIIHGTVSYINVIELKNKEMDAFIKKLTKKVDSLETINGEVSLNNQDQVSTTYSEAKPYDTYSDAITELLLKRRSCFDEMAKLREKNNGSIDKECANYLQEIKTIDTDLIQNAKGMCNTYAWDESTEIAVRNIIRALPYNVSTQVNEGYKEGVKQKILRDYSDSNEISMEKFYDLTQIPSDVLHATVNQIGMGKEEKIAVEALTLDNGRQVMATRTIDLQSSRAYILSELNDRKLDSIQEQLNTKGDDRKEAKKELTKLVNSILKHDPTSKSLRYKDLSNLKAALGEINEKSLGIKDRINSLFNGRDGKNTLLQKLEKIEQNRTKK